MARNDVLGATCATCIRYMADLASHAGRIVGNRISKRIASRTQSSSSNGASRLTHNRLEQLEGRQMMASVTLTDGVLTLAGTVNAQNTITVKPSNTTNIEAKVGTVGKIFQASSINKIVIYGQNYNDTIKIDASIKKPTSIDARAGNDSVSGGGGNDTVWGDAGNDTIYGNAGNDALNGEDGNDRIDGGAGTDTLNGGTGTNNVTSGET